jgi:hypothetical protein
MACIGSRIIVPCICASAKARICNAASFRALYIGASCAAHGAGLCIGSSTSAPGVGFVERSREKADNSLGVAEAVGMRRHFGPNIDWNETSSWNSRAIVGGGA